MTKDQTSLTVRAAVWQDAPAIASLSFQLGYPTTTDQTHRRLEKIERDHDHAVFVAELRGVVSGWIEVDADVLLIDEAYAEIRGLVVDEALRGQGVGRALLEQAEAWARSLGCNQIKVRSNVIRSTAHLFYESMGYQSYKIQKNFIKEL